MTSEIADLLAEADRAATAGDPARARAALEQVAARAPDFETWLKLAAMRRVTGDLPGSLDAVHAALALAPLDFVALLSRAMLLERLGSPEADQAFARALAQQPAGEVAPSLAAMVAHAERRVAATTEQRAVAFAAAMAPAEAAATPDEARRIARFRDNTLRRTRTWHSEPTHFAYPGLVEREFHDRDDFPWLAGLEAATEAIAEELATIASVERAELVPYVQYSAHEPVQQWSALNHSRDWTAIHLLRHGEVVEANARHCPRTMAALAKLPQPRVAGCSPNAMFSLLAPRTTIPPHNGIDNTRLVCHLPLIVPEGCWFRVGAETRPWRRGEAWVFDDTIEHEAANPSDALRVVLICDVWHPGLAPAERNAARALMETAGAANAL